MSQEYHSYCEDDHLTWATLINRQSELHTKRISRAYLDGYEKLGLSNAHVADIKEVSDNIEAISGWSLVPVSGLIPTKEFFYLLINKKYPVTVSIRKPEELDFSEQPDIFHDISGHVPLLTNSNFTKFLTAYSILALKYTNNDRALEFLGRLYWFTYEMGLIVENGEIKPYGGAIITSANEIANVYNAATPKHAFDIDHIFKTQFNPYKLQNEYFVINSFDDLFDSLEKLEVKLIDNLLLPSEDLVLHNYSLNKNLGKGFNNVIGFLNDIQFKYPQATSFVAGQPDENFFEIENHISKFDSYVDHLINQTGDARKKIVNGIGQYNKTKGIVNDVVAQYLHNDENIKISGNDILITVGAQEAFSIIVSTICDREKDVILIEDPSYIGISSFAKVFGYNVKGVGIDEEGINLDQLKKKILETNEIGKRVKLVYVIPDYQNPTGCCMTIGNRLKLLELANKYNFLIIEDGVYNSFTYAQKKNPTLKSLDKYNRVIYVGSFSKSLFPGLRIGLIAANQKVENDQGEVTGLIDEMVKVKAQLTNNTSTVDQAILAGVLLSNNYSLSEWSKPKFESYKKKRDCMIEALNKYIRAYTEEWAQDIAWNEPDGGFFIKMTVPFEVDIENVFESAKQHNVIFCPMRYFYLNKGGENEIRLTFSNLSLLAIDQGVKKLADYIKAKVVEVENKSLVNSY